MSRRRANRYASLLVALLLAVGLSEAVASQHILRDVGDEGDPEPYLLILPFAFYQLVQVVVKPTYC